MLAQASFLTIPNWPHFCSHKDLELSGLTRPNASLLNSWIIPLNLALSLSHKGSEIIPLTSIIMVTFLRLEFKQKLSVVEEKQKTVGLRSEF